MSQINTVFEYNGEKFEFDVRDADDAEKFEVAINDLSEAEKSAPKDGKASTQIRITCRAIKKFFDTCLGDGAGEKICGKKDNVAPHYDAYEKFLEVVRLQRNDILTTKNTFAKYSNRSQRRNAEKQKK